MKSRILWAGFLALVIGLFTASALINAQQSQNRRQGVIVRAAKPYDRVKAAIRGLGGEITHEYQNIDAIAANVPEENLHAVAALAEVGALYKDVVVNSPRPIHRPAGGFQTTAAVATVSHRGAVALSGDDVARLGRRSSNSYDFNSPYTGAAALHSEGIRGQGVVVAVIDSGVANNASIVPALAGSVIGGESFVTIESLSATSTQNTSHGTQVASMIAAHAGFIFNKNDFPLNSLLVHAPGSIVECDMSCNPATQAIVPMIGAAPDAKIYAVKVFPSTGAGTTKATLVAAMDRLITIRKNFNRGMASVPANPGCGAEIDPCKFNSLNIQVVNMSLGTVALFAGRELEDELTERMLEVGMTPVVSAGNDGFAAMTGSAPGTGFGALTVGAANITKNERVFIDGFFGLGFGILYRPNNVEQTAWFSSRGPTADGRIDPDLVVNGVGNYTQAANGTIMVDQGTSFSAPTVSGAAALLFGAVPDGREKATRVRNALEESANARLLTDGSGPIDQGAGYLDIPRALERLRSGRVSSTIERSRPSKNVAENIKRLGFDTVKFTNDRFSARLRNLKQGETAQFFVETKDETNHLTVRLEGVTFHAPPADQNPLFGGDDLFVRIADAPTSFFRNNVNSLFDGFIFSDTTIEIDEPQTGLVRVAVQGDGINGGTASASVVIERTKRPLSPESAQGSISDKELVEVRLLMPPRKSEAVFELFWDHDWSAYPTNDVDMILCPPGARLGAPVQPGVPMCNRAGATLASPERVVIANPNPGQWSVFVHGFTVHTRNDAFKLRISADGVRLRAN